MDGAYRRIEVKTTAGKYDLAYRRGYNADDTPASDAKPDSDSLRALLMPGMPNSTQILYTPCAWSRPILSPPQEAAARGDNFKLDGQLTRYTVDFFIQTKDLQLSAATNGDRQGKIQIELVAFGRNGKPLNWTRSTANLSLKPATFDAIEKSGLRAHLEIDVPNADIYLNTGVYDWNTGKAGPSRFRFSHPRRNLPQSELSRRAPRSIESCVSRLGHRCSHWALQIPARRTPTRCQPQAVINAHCRSQVGCRCFQESVRTIGYRIDMALANGSSERKTFR